MGQRTSTSRVGRLRQELVASQRRTSGGDELLRAVAATADQRCFNGETRLELQWGIDREEHFGTVDVYASNGFRGSYPWHSSQYNMDPNGSIGIRQISVPYNTSLPK